MALTNMARSMKRIGQLRRLLAKIKAKPARYGREALSKARRGKFAVGRKIRGVKDRVGGAVRSTRRRYKYGVTPFTAERKRIAKKYGGIAAVLGATGLSSAALYKKYGTLRHPKISKKRKKREKY